MRRALQATADYLATLAGGCPEPALGAGLAYRALLYNTLAELPREQAALAYALLDGLEHHDPHAFRLLKPDPCEALDDLPHPPVVQSKAGLVLVQVEGEICYRSFTAEIEAIRKADEVRLMINSTGGDSVAALNLIEATRGKRTVATVIKLAFSSACTILQSCQVRRVCAGAKIMVHSPTCFAGGNARDLRQQATLLDMAAAEHKELYHRSPPELVEEWFTDGKDHYFTAQEAVAVGLADEIVPRTPPTGGNPQPGGGDDDLVILLVELIERARPLFKDPDTFTVTLRKLLQPAPFLSGVKQNQNEVAPAGGRCRFGT